MAQIIWQNSSSQPIKWIAFVSGSFQGNMLQPGQSYTADDTDVFVAGFSQSGYTGFVFTMPIPPPPFSTVLYATDTVDNVEAELAKLRRQLTKP